MILFRSKSYTIESKCNSLEKKLQLIEIKREHVNIPFGTLIFKQYSVNLLNYFQRCYFTPLSMQRPNSKSSTSTDCSIYSKNNFKKESHYSSNRQGQQFLSEANAFIQLSYNRFNDILNRVIQLLNNLRTKKLIFHFISLLFSLISVRYPGPPIRRRNQSNPIGSRRPMKSDRNPGDEIRPELKRRICFEFRQYPTIRADFYMRKKNREKS